MPFARRWQRSASTLAHTQLPEVAPYPRSLSVAIRVGTGAKSGPWAHTCRSALMQSSLACRTRMPRKRAAMSSTRLYIAAFALLGLGMCGAGAQDAIPEEPRDTSPPAAPAGDAHLRPDLRDSVCLMIEAAARAHGLPLEFFARVIWQESRFRPDAVGPRTRSGDSAQGIAQFMPRTAAERGLLDPFDPVQALPKSAEFLRELADQFGNLGLAAAAYNAGPGRLREFLSGRRPLPAETRHYVLAITGISVDEWASSGKREPLHVPKAGCGELMALLHRAPNPFVQKLEERVNLVAAGRGAC